MDRMKEIRIFVDMMVIAFCIFMLTPTVSVGSIGIPVILGAGVDTGNNVLVIEGAHFTPVAMVTLGTLPLNVQSTTDTEIITTFSWSDFLPGTYLLKVRFTNGRFALFTVSLCVTTATSSGGCGIHPPEASLSADPPTAVVGTPVILSLTVADLDLMPPSECGSLEFFTYSWVVLSVPPGSGVASMTPPFGSSVYFTPDVPGSYSVQAIVTDSTGRTSRPVISIDVAL